jgi:nucleoside-diphosphate-sugar epimerase
MKPYANVYLAGFMKLIHQFLYLDYVSDMIAEGMSKFLRIHVMCFENYREVPVHFIGSVAYFFSEQLRKEAEAAWQAFAVKQKLTLNIFRLAGIYGPGRGPFAKVRAGTARRIIKPNQVFSRIHVEDIAQTLAASVANPNPGAIYNVCDDLAAPPEDVIAFAADLLNLPIPPAENWDTADMTPMARSFYSESKRVQNHRIKLDLGVTLKYPDYKSGLRALLLQS